VVIPISDDNPTRRRPVVTWLLLALNIGVFVLVQPWQENTCVQQAFFIEWAAVPEEVLSGAPLNGAEVAASTTPQCGIPPEPGKNVYLSVLTAMFLHAGWAHLLGNMLYLWIFGNNVEDRLGRLPFLLFYLGTGVAATLVFVLFNPGLLSTLVGASGAIAGVLGAYLVLYPTARVTLVIPPLFFFPFRLPALLVLGFWFVLQLFSGQAADMAGGGVAYLAHVAGFVAGFVAVLLLGHRPQRRRPPPRPPLRYSPAPPPWR